MFPVSDIWEDAKRLTGNARESRIYRRITEGVEMLANKGDWDPLQGYLDIASQDLMVALPREVETILALNIGTTPAFGRDKLFEFHLNGPGSNDCGEELGYVWADRGEACTYREIECPSQLVATSVLSEDNNAELWVYGYDVDQNWIRTEVGDTWFDGWPVPVLYSSPAPGVDAPAFKRIVRVRKAKTKGPIRLSTVDSGPDSGVLLGIYEWDETEPHFRRIKLSRNADWVRIHFRRRTLALGSQTDLIPLHNSAAVTMALQALRYYDDGDFASGEAAEATAVRWLTEEQFTRNPPVSNPIQVQDLNGLLGACDDVD